MLSPEDLEAADAAFDAFGLIQEDWGRVYPGFGVVQFPELELDESDEGLTPLVVLVKREGTVPPSSQGVGAGGGNFALASPARPSPPRASLTSGQGPMVRERVSPTVDPTNALATEQETGGASSALENDRVSAKHGEVAGSTMEIDSAEASEEAGEMAPTLKGDGVVGVEKVDGAETPKGGEKMDTAGEDGGAAGAEKIDGAETAKTGGAPTMYLEIDSAGKGARESASPGEVDSGKAAKNATEPTGATKTKTKRVTGGRANLERDGFEERGEALESPNAKARLPRGSRKRRVDSDDEDDEEVRAGGAKGATLEVVAAGVSKKGKGKEKEVVVEKGKKGGKTVETKKRKVRIYECGFLSFWFCLGN